MLIRLKLCGTLWSTETPEMEAVETVRSSVAAISYGTIGLKDLAVQTLAVVAIATERSAEIRTAEERIQFDLNSAIPLILFIANRQLAVFVHRLTSFNLYANDLCKINESNSSSSVITSQATFSA
jgi:hypothetical protein